MLHLTQRDVQLNKISFTLQLFAADILYVLFYATIVWLEVIQTA